MMPPFDGGEREVWMRRGGGGGGVFDRGGDRGGRGGMMHGRGGGPEPGGGFRDLYDRMNRDGPPGMKGRGGMEGPEWGGPMDIGEGGMFRGPPRGGDMFHGGPVGGPGARQPPPNWDWTPDRDRFVNINYWTS